MPASSPGAGFFILDALMDYIFICLAAACVLLAGRRRSLFLWVVLVEFSVSAALIKLPVGDPWWFVVYAVVNCAFVGAVMYSGHRLAREYAGTLIAAALIAVAVFCEFFMGGEAVYGVRPAMMAWICTYQIWLAASGAGLIGGTPLEAARGVFAGGSGRVRRPRFDPAPRNVGSRL